MTDGNQVPLTPDGETGESTGGVDPAQIGAIGANPG